VPSRPYSLVHPVLFGAYAVVFLYAENLDLVRLDEILRALVVAVVAAALVLVVTSLALRDVAAGAVLASVLVLLFFFALTPIKGLVYRISTPPALEGVLHGGLLGIEFVLVAVAAIVSTLAIVRRWPQRLPGINTAMTVGAIVLLAFPVVTIATTRPAALPSGASGPSQLIASRSSQRDIFYVILDRYGSNYALDRSFGVTSNDLPDWLGQQGFFVADRAVANYDRTSLSVVSTLSLDYIDDVLQSMGPDSTDWQSVFHLIQDHSVGRFLKEQGYEYVHVGNWKATMGLIDIADRNVRLDAINEFEAVLYDETALPALAALVQLQAPVPQVEQLQYNTARFQFSSLASLADEPGRKFVFAHVLLPHDPFVFQADGTFYYGWERGGRDSEDDRFQNQVAYVNSAVKELVTHLMDRPYSERPIVIIQADEGPYPPRYRSDLLGFQWESATDEEIATKFGILDAFYFPTDDGEPANLPGPYATISSVNTFRLLFDHYFGTGMGLLPDRTFAPYVAEKPFDVFEISYRLAASP